MGARPVLTTLVAAALAVPLSASGGAGGAAGAAPDPEAYFFRQVPQWALVGQSFDLEATLTVGDADPRSVDGAVVRLQTRPAGDGPWSTVDRGVAELAPREKTASGEVRLRISDDEDTDVRVQFSTSDGFVGSEAYPVTVTGTGPRFPVRRTTGDARSPWVAVGNDGRHAVWKEDDSEYPVGVAGATFGRFADRRYYSGSTGDVAADAPVTVNSDYQVVGGEDYDGRTLKLHDFRTGRTVDAARTLDGSRMTTATQPSLDSDGAVVTFAATSDRLVAGAPVDRRSKVYRAVPSARTVTYVGPGDGADVSPGGRYVVWVHPSGQVRMLDHRTGERTVAYAPTEHRVHDLHVLDGGRGLVLVRRVGDGPSTAVRVDLPGRDVTVLGPADEASASDDGQRVALVRDRGRFGGDVYLWRRGTAVPRLVTEGPDGEPAGTVYGADLDPGGRRLIVGVVNASTPLVPGVVRGARTVLYDLRFG